MCAAQAVTVLQPASARIAEQAPRHAGTSDDGARTATTASTRGRLLTTIAVRPGTTTVTHSNSNVRPLVDHKHSVIRFSPVPPRRRTAEVQAGDARQKPLRPAAGEPVESKTQ